LPLTVSQGSSEYNITVLIDQKDSERALRAVHSRFYLSDVPIGVGVVGPGLIGGTLIEQLREQVRVQGMAAWCVWFGYVVADAYTWQQACRCMTSASSGSCDASYDDD
jgi:hypothetical protein